MYCQSLNIHKRFIFTSISESSGLSGPVPCFFGYKTEFFPFQDSPKNLNPSYKMDLDLRDCLGRVKFVF